MAKCDDCEAEVRWALSRSGKRMMMNAEPSDDGRYVIMKDETRLATDVDRRLLRPLFSCHWDVCPERQP
jgi:hypothetical protein